MADSCLICSEPLSVGESCQIGSKGLASLVKVSQLLHDCMEAQFLSKPELILHTNCRKKYTRPSNIRAAAKSTDKHDAPVPTNSRTRRSLDKVFDFETDCLFSGKDATVGIKLELKYRKTVSNCETLDLQGSVRSQCLKRDDEWGRTVLGRLDSVHDLPAAEGRYHRTCYPEFFHEAHSHTPGRPHPWKVYCFWKTLWPHRFIK